jgi:hypothetical protein
MNRPSFDFSLAIIIVLGAAFFASATYLHLITVSFFVGPLRLAHWFGIIGTIYIALATPLFVFMKKAYPKRTMGLYRFHILGSLLAFGLISIHFAAQIDRPAISFPDLGTGLAMYIAMALQITTGFTQRFRFKLVNRINLKTNMFIHASLIMPFYIIIILHTLHGLGYI